MQMRPALWTLIGVFLLVFIGGQVYANLQNIPASVAVPVGAALALEACLYVAAALGDVRVWLAARIGRAHLAVAMTVSAVIPYCLYAVPLGVFRMDAFLALAAAAAGLSFWFVVCGRGRASQVLLVIGFAVVLLSPLFPWIYGKPWPRLALAIAGQLMWTRLAFLSVLSLANAEVKGFGLIPTLREWCAGLTGFALFLPVGALLGWALHFGAFRLKPMPWWQTVAIGVATFLGMLWVVALREEFLVRGLVQEWFERWLASGWKGLVVTSLIFGSVHLPFRGFPNWRFAILATVAGLFYGRVYQVTRSVRAAMVTHALVNTAWRVFFW